MIYIKKMTNILLAGLVVLSVVGCSGRPINIPAIPEESYQDLEDRGRPLQATASGFQLLLFIPIGVNDRVEEAYSQIKAQAGSDYIADVKIKEEWYWGFVGTGYKTTITAIAYRIDKEKQKERISSSLVKSTETN